MMNNVILNIYILTGGTKKTSCNWEFSSINKSLSKKKKKKSHWPQVDLLKPLELNIRWEPLELNIRWEQIHPTHWGWSELLIGGLYGSSNPEGAALINSQITIDMSPFSMHGDRYPTACVSPGHSGQGKGAYLLWASSKGRNLYLYSHQIKQLKANTDMG